RFRIDGILHHRMTQPIERFAAVASRIKLVSGLDIAERRLPQDGRMTTRMGGTELDVRVSTVPCVHGESIVMRLLPKEREELSLLNLGMEEDHLALMRGWAASSGGIVLVTGPTGSGKSTTLHAALSDTNDGIRKIITVEDPVEFRVPGITQIQAHNEIGYTFARALRAILRQDPDVIMIGEIRDLETAEIAIQSALSGHLVLSTLHTNDAVSAFTRLIDMGVEPFLVAAPVKGVQAQRLIRKLCTHCSEPVPVPTDLQTQLDRLPAAMTGHDFRRAVGCDDCQHTGYSGRMGIYQLVEVDQKLQDLIVEGATLNELRRHAAENGMRTLLQDGLIKASRGLTSIDEVYRVITAEESS
ncbi:MAG: GspE/PulE family protein, partial [Proteobacteria bacterium]|nr:GspE/PulE family protein [Pseudomonadota bacterium]